MKICPTCGSTYPSDFAVCPRDAAALLEVGVWSEGTVVRGKYLIQGKLGEGGMASVYKALHVRFNELRALKVMAPHLAADPTFVRRFMQEAVITRRLQHPNAVRVDDIDEAEDGRPFIVMEYIEGRSLKEVIQQEAPIPVERVCSIAKQVAAALDAAHCLGMVHRDIKPANIVLLTSSCVAQGFPRPRADYSRVFKWRSAPRRDGAPSKPAVLAGSPVGPAHSPHPRGGEGASRDPVGTGPRSEAGEGIELAKVLDFGIAKLKEAHLEDSKLAHLTLTGAGMVIGTPAYMSPEQAKGVKGDQLDGRSDIYSLAVVMYQMLCGDLPIKADSEIGLLMAHIQAQPRPIRSLCPEVPERIAKLVMRCLEKEPELRFATGQALVEEIEDWEGERVRLACAQAEAESPTSGRAEAERAKPEKAERERLMQEMARATVRIKAEREQPDHERAEAAWKEQAVGGQVERECTEREPADLEVCASVGQDRASRTTKNVENQREQHEEERRTTWNAEEEQLARGRAEAGRRGGERAQQERKAQEAANGAARAEEQRRQKAGQPQLGSERRAELRAEPKRLKATVQPTLAQPPIPSVEPGTSHKAWLWVAAATVALGLGTWYFSTRSEKTIKPSPETVKVKSQNGVKYVWIPPGTFEMGCSPGDKECFKDEKPAHQVTITKGFWLEQTPVTAGAYKRFARETGRAMPPEPKLGSNTVNPGWAKEQMPIVNVTWEESQAYCQWLGGRLPTEAQWEYAARAGSKEARYGPLDDVAWYEDNSGRDRIDSTRVSQDGSHFFDGQADRLAANGNTMQAVGLKQPNDWRLYDMLGNVREWVNDWYGETYYQSGSERDPQGPDYGSLRVLRGGSWDSVAGYIRVSDRYSGYPDSRYLDAGCRCLREGDIP
jgi:formylglycine-generating enzyme required for sulfatase activity/serine/threonine protein kinase